MTYQAWCFNFIESIEYRNAHVSSMVYLLVCDLYEKIDLLLGSSNVSYYGSNKRSKNGIIGCDIDGEVKCRWYRLFNWVLWNILICQNLWLTLKRVSLIGFSEGYRNIKLHDFPDKISQIRICTQQYWLFCLWYDTKTRRWICTVICS